MYEQEFVPEMQRKGYSWSLTADGEGSNATWRDGRKQALQAYADETYGDGGKPFRLVSRADHSAFKECSRCKTLRLAVAKLMREGARSDAIAAAKAEQKKHSDWFLGQRNELEKMRQSGKSNETVFEQV